MATKEQKNQWAKEYYHRNKEKSLARHKQWYALNKTYALEQQRLKKRERKQQIILALGGKCMHCLQEYHPAIFEFHHLNPKTKDKDPSKMMSLRKERLEEELKNCILLCANCHRYEHHKDTY